MDCRLEIFDMEFTNTEFTQFSLSVVLIRVVEFRYNTLQCGNDFDDDDVLQGNSSEQISMGKLRSSSGEEGHQD